MYIFLQLFYFFLGFSTIFPDCKSDQIPYPEALGQTVTCCHLFCLCLQHLSLAQCIEVVSLHWGSGAFLGSTISPNGGPTVESHGSLWVCMVLGFQVLPGQQLGEQLLEQGYREQVRCTSVASCWRAGRVAGSVPGGLG